MKVASIILMLAMTAGCAITTTGIRQRAPYKSYASAKVPAMLAQCIAQNVAGASVIPGATETVVNIQNPDGPILISWQIVPSDSGSAITVWRANSMAPGIGKAEVCF